MKENAIDREDVLKREKALKKAIVAKYQINFDKLKETTELSPTKKYLTWVQNTLVGTVGGMGFGSTLMFVIGWSVIAIAGITLAALFTTLATVSGGVLIGVFSLLYARQQTKKDEENLKASITEVDEKQKTLQNQILNLTKSFQQLNELLQKKYKLAVEKGLLKEDETPFDQLINGDFAELDKPAELVELQEIINARRTMLRKLIANLSLISGDSYHDKLAHLFNVKTDSLPQAIIDQANVEQKPFIENGLPSLLKEINRMTQFNTPTSERGLINDRTEFRDLKDEFDNSLKKTYETYKKEQHHKVIRKLTTSYGIAALGGFFTGIGGYIAIASLVAGGAAALLTGGAALPILLGGLAVAGVCAGLAVLYRRHVEHKKQAAIKMLDRTKATLNLSNSDIQKANEATNDVLNKYTKQAKKDAKTETLQQELDRKSKLDKLEGNIKALTGENKRAWQDLSKEYHDIQAVMDSVRLLTQGVHHKETHHKEAHYKLNIGHIERFILLKNKLEALRTDLHEEATELQITLEELKAFEGYQKVDAKIEKILKNITELEQYNQHYQMTVEKKSLLEKGEQEKQPEYREKTIKKGDKSHH